MKQSIYIECYEGLSARMLTEALLDLMPEGKAARKLVVGLRKLSCSEAARQEMLHNMQERIHEFALPADAERLFARAYGIWLNAKATVEHVEPEELRFSKRDFDGVIAMMTTAIGMEQLQIGEVICPVLYEGFECITTQDGKKTGAAAGDTVHSDGYRYCIAADGAGWSLGNTGSSGTAGSV